MKPCWLHFGPGRIFTPPRRRRFTRRPPGEVTKEQRRHAKAINFGLIYGMSAFGLSRTTDLTLGEAEDFVKAYFRQFPGVKRYLDGHAPPGAQIRAMWKPCSDGVDISPT